MVHVDTRVVLVEETGKLRFEEGTGFLLSRLGAMAERSWSSLLSSHSITQIQYTALVALEQWGPLGQGRLAELIAVDPRNIVAIVDSLSEHNLAERRIDPRDGRRRQVHLTARGRRLSKDIAHEAAVTQAEFLGPLGPKERSTLNRMLQRLYDALVGGD